MLCFQNKKHFKRFVDSVLGKSTKMQKLVKELRQQFSEESTAPPRTQSPMTS